MNKHYNSLTISIGNQLCNIFLSHYHVPYILRRSMTNVLYLYSLDNDETVTPPLYDGDKIHFIYDNKHNEWLYDKVDRADRDT